MSADKTYSELIEEISLLQQKISKLEQSEPLSKEMKEVLSESEAKYRAMIESSLVAVYIVQDRLFRFVNKRWCEIYGYQYEEVVDKMAPPDLVYPEDKKIMEESVRKRVSGEAGTTEYEIRSVRRDGKIITMRIFGSIMPYKGRLAILGTAIDITGLRKAEERLRANQARLSEVMDLAHVVYWEVDPEDNMFILNDPFYAFHGTTVEQEGGYRMSHEELAERFIHPDDRKLFLKKVQDGIVHVGPEYISDIELRIIRRPEEVQYAQSRTRIIKDKSGHLVKIYGSIQDITERKSMEEALKASEEKYRKIFEGANDGIYQTTPEGKFLSVNPAFARMFGYASAQEMISTVTNIGKQIYVDPRNREEIIQRLREDNRLDGFEVEVYRKDRSRFWVSMNIHAGRDASGSILYFERTNVDITKRKKAENGLKESEQRFKEMANMLPQTVCEFDLDGRFIFVNKNGLTTFGYTQEEINQGVNLSQIIIPEDHERARSNIQKVADSQDIGDREYTAITKDGRTFSVLVYSTPIVKNNKPVGIRCILIDITERKRAEKALIESEEKYRNVIENSLIGFHIMKDGLFKYVNKQFCEILGYSYEEIVDKAGPMDFVHPDDREMVAENIRKRTSGETDRTEYEFRAIRKDGQLINIKVIGTTMVYEGERVPTGTILDITREKNLETQLRQSQKIEAIGTLAGGIAHDFNNILTALMGYASLMQDKMDASNPLLSYVDQILIASQKGVDLTRSLLAFSRQQPITLTPLSLNKTVKMAEKLLKRLLTEDIELRIFLSDDNPIAMADKSQIDQILFNLVTNARDSMPHGGTLTIETSQAAMDDAFKHFHGYGEKGTYALFSISDTGVGMDEPTRERIFDPFFTTKEIGKGTGLGLSPVSGIVNQHKGYINAYSEPGVGTTFHIYLPATTQAVKKSEAVSGPIRGGNETVLIAEDSDEVRNLLKIMLTSRGYSIIEAVDGEDAIRRFSEVEKIDLAILDTVMPKKNGREVYDEIIRLKPDSKVLFTSGYTRDVILAKGMEDGRFEFIQKPVSPNTLLRKIRQMLDDVKEPN
jgi:PAS domain S-box-containing protein